MTTEKPKDLQEMLVKSIESLRSSPAEREKYPALDRLLSRIDAGERLLPGRGSAPAWRLMRPLLGPISSAAAGFAGAALALALLPSWWFASPPAAPPTSSTSPAIVAAVPREADDSARRLMRSIHRLERAIHGLEKFQPLVESRIEWLEDALQRKYADAYASNEDMTRSQDPYTAVQMRQDRGAFF